MVNFAKCTTENFLKPCFFGENINYSTVPQNKIFLTGAPKRIKLPSIVLFVYPFQPILTKYKTNLEVTFCLLH